MILKSPCNQATIVEFERLVYRNAHPDALQMFLGLVIEMTKNRVDFAPISGDQQQNPAPQITPTSSDLHRLTSAITALFSSPDCYISDADFITLASLKDWISAIFYATPLKNADHIINILAKPGFVFDDQALIKFVALYTTESDLSFNCDELYGINPRLAVSFGLGILSSSQSITTSAHGKREYLLGWLPEVIDRMRTLDGLPTEILQDVLMNCSYAQTSRKHEIKRALNDLIRRDLLARGFEDIHGVYKKKTKPIMLVVLDWWTSYHAMYRCYGPLLHACRESFHLVALAYSELIDDKAAELFDEVYREFSTSDTVYTNCSRAVEAVRKISPDIVYYPSIGMSLGTIYLSNLRLAPLQISTLGHPATTGSRFIDVVLNSPEFSGKDDVFYEKLVLMPERCFHFIPIGERKKDVFCREGGRTFVNVAIAAAAKKLNPGVLQTCLQIRNEAKTPVVFHFYLASVSGVQFLRAKQAILEIITDAVIHPNQGHAAYLAALGEADMFLCPFPFGNTNGIIDAVRLGLPGVCLYGDQPHSAIDRGMFRMFGLPEDLVTYTIEEYVHAAVRLIDDTCRRHDLNSLLLATDMDRCLKSGSLAGFPATILSLYESCEIGPQNS